MDKKRQIAGALSAILLVTSLPGPILAKEGKDLPGIKAEAEDSLHSRVIDAQVKAKKLETQNQTLLQARAPQEDPEPEESEEGQTVTRGDFVFNVATKSIVGYTGKDGQDVELTLPDSFEVKGEKIPVENLGDEENGEPVFQNKSFKTIKLPKGLKKILDSGLQGIKLQDRLELPEGLEELGWLALSESTLNGGLTFPKSLKEIGIGALTHATVGSDLTIPENIKSIKEGAFSGATLKKVTFIGQKTVEAGIFSSSAQLEELDLGEGLEEISKEMFQECKGLKKLTLPSSLKRIQKNAFQKSQFEEIEFNSNVSLEGENIFDCCRKLSKINLPEGLTRIPSGTFSNCDALKEITIPSTVTDIEFGAFSVGYGMEPSEYTIYILGPERPNLFTEGSYTLGMNIVYKTEKEDIIKDPVLKEFVNTALYYKEHESWGPSPTPEYLSKAITKKELGGLTEIKADYDYFKKTGKTVQSLEGLEEAKSLRYLEIPFTGSDLSPLKDLKKLECLALATHVDKNFTPGKYPLEDISPLAGLSKLEYLSFYETKVKDISPLKDLENLRFVYLNYNEIESLDILPTYKGEADPKNSIMLNGNRISDFSPLKNSTFYTKGNIGSCRNQRISLTVEKREFENPVKGLDGNFIELVPKDSSVQISKIMEGQQNQKYKIETTPSKDTIELSFKAGTSQMDDGISGIVTLDISKLKEQEQEEKLADRLTPKPPNKKIVVVNGAKLTDVEKENVKQAVINVNKDIGDKIKNITVENNGTTNVLYIDESQDQILGKDLVEQGYGISFAVYGLQGKTFIQSLYQAKVKIYQEGKEVSPEKLAFNKWLLSPGTYKYEISCLGYTSKEEEFTVEKKSINKVVELQKEDTKIAQPKITSIELIEIGSGISLGKGTINGNMVSFTVPNPKYRDLIFNGKATIKAETENGYRYLASDAPSATIWNHREGTGSYEELQGKSSKAIPFKENAPTSFTLYGNGGKVSYYTFYIKESDQQHIVLFEAPGDKTIELGTIRLQFKTGRTQRKTISRLYQLVNDGEQAEELTKWIDRTTSVTAFMDGPGEFKGWFIDESGTEKYDFTNKVHEDIILHAIFEDSTNIGNYDKPFTVSFEQYIKDETYPVKILWSLNNSEDFKEYISSQKQEEDQRPKVRVGDVLNFKIEEKNSNWKLRGITHRYGFSELPISQDKKGVFHLQPGPSYDSYNGFYENEVHTTFVKSKDAPQPFDINKQHYINWEVEGAVATLENLWEEISDRRISYNPLVQEGDTIRFRVSGEQIERVEVKKSDGTVLESKMIKEDTDPDTGLKTNHYSFVMPDEDVSICVHGNYEPKNYNRRTKFKIVSNEGKEIPNDQVQKLTISPLGLEETIVITDLNEDKYIPVNDFGLDYGYQAILKDHTTYYGKFHIKPKKLTSDTYTIKLDKPKTQVKTKEQYESILDLAKKLVNSSKYTEESKKKLADVIERVENEVKLQANYTKAAEELQNALNEFDKANTLPDKEKPGTDKEKAKESLEGLIRRLSNLKKADYESKAWDAFDKEMDKAKAVLKDANSSEDALNTARRALTQAKAELDKHKIVPEDMTKAEKNLRDLIKTIERLEEKNYTKETWKDLKYALDDAKDELNYSKRTERSLERAYDKLNKAYKDLKLADKLAQEAEKINQDHKVLVRNSSYQNMTDIKSHWARDFIKYCMDRGYLVGTSITSFSPDRPTTRAEFVTVLSRLAGIKEENYKKNKFTDVPKGVYYEAAVNWAQEKKIVEGTGSSRFAPDQTMTREEMATILDRYFQATNKAYGNRGALYFKDQGEMSSWAADSVRRMTQAGILHGTDRNTFEPKSSFTRAELATVIYQLNK